MEVVKPCSVCYSGAARFTCMLCGKLACPNCYEPVEGLCKFCAKIPRERRVYGEPGIAPRR